MLLLPAFLYVAVHNKWLATLAYLTTFTPLLRLPLGFDAALIDILYPAVLLTASWYIGIKFLSGANELKRWPNNQVAFIG